MGTGCKDLRQEAKRRAGIFQTKGDDLDKMEVVKRDSLRLDIFGERLAAKEMQSGMV